MLAVLPTLIHDINQQPAGLTAFNQSIEIGGVAYFGGASDGGDNGLWRTDGTSAGTQKVSGVQVVGEMLAVGSIFYFHGFSQTSDAELWKSDGTSAGTVPIADINPGPGFWNIRELTLVGNTIFFSAFHQESGVELWKTDGTAAGTTLVKDIAPGPSFSDPEGLTNVNGTLLFSSRNNELGRELWKSDGTTAGTVLVKDINPLAASAIRSYSQVRTAVNANGLLLFAADDGVNGTNLWRSDGTPAGTSLVTDFGIFPEAEVARFQPFSTIGGKALFLASGDDLVEQLWISDGSQAGTTPISAFGQFSFVGSILNRSETDVIFSLGDALTSEWRLWKTNGTSLGTVPFGPDLADEPVLMTAGSKLLFTAPAPLPGLNVWTSDGTDGGTSFVKNVDPGPQPGFATFHGSAGGQALFQPFGSATSELWSSDGTPGGTVRLEPPGAGTASSAFPWSSARQVIGNQLYFAASDGLLGSELWRTDGTPGGTALVKDIVAGPGSSDPAYMAQAGGKLFFVADDGMHGRELWTSDGTALGTRLVLDATPGPDDSFIANLTNVNGQLLFSISRGGLAAALGKTDGTEAGTVIISKVQPASFDGSYFANVNGVLYFRGSDGDGGEELWRSDGTEPGTVRVKDIAAGTVGSYPSDLTAVGNRLFFRANDGAKGAELWTSLGTPETTVLVKDIFPEEWASFPYRLTNVNGTLLFTATDDQGTQLWKSDGTSGGTVRLTQDLSDLRDFTPVGGTLFFQAADGEHGYELWKSDGTPAGTVLVKDLVPGPDAAYLSELTNVGGMLFFRVADRNQNSQIWQSDGTDGGTKLFTQLPGQFQNGPLYHVGSRLVFDVRTPQHGTELHAARLVNVAPSFVKGPNIDATDEDGPTARSAWASGIAAGPADEAPQAVQFVLQNSNPAIFSVPPAIDGSGRLTFTPQPNVSGSATITIRLRDDGGTFLGGSDTSPAQTLTINVAKPHILHNAINGLDVTLDNNVLASDALAIINHINAFGIGPVPDDAVSGAPYLDVVPDNRILANDALAIINHINAFGPTIGSGEGEGLSIAASADAAGVAADLLALLAADTADSVRRRRG